MAEFQTLVQCLQHWTEKLEDAPAFIFRNKFYERYVLTWNKLYALSGRFAAVLNGWGLTRGHLVVNTLPNSPERVVCEAGILMSGAASVNAQCQLADGSDLLRTLSMSRASVIVVDPDAANSPWDVLQSHIVVGKDGNSVTSESLPELKKVYFVRRIEGNDPGDFLCLLGSQQHWFQSDDIAANDVMTVFTTSGTTGFSKLVVYTHRNYLDYIGSADTAFDAVSQGGRMYFSISPLGWVGGYVGITVISGFTQVLCDIRGGGIPEDMPEFVWRSVREENCSNALILPVHLARLMEIAGREESTRGQDAKTAVERVDDSLMTSSTEKLADEAKDNSSTKVKPGDRACRVNANRHDEDEDNSQRDRPKTRAEQSAVTAAVERRESTGARSDTCTSSTWRLDMIITGGMPVSRAMILKALALAHSVVVGYGSTDVGMVSMAAIAKESDDYVDCDTGLIRQGVEVKIVHEDDEDIEVPANQLGRILVKTDSAPSGYLNDPQMTAAAFTKDGYFRTGDIGRLDHRGHLIVEGRGGDAIMRGAYIFYPGWLEARICACPGADNVLVVGVPDPDLNEELCACVVLESDDVTMSQVREFVEKDIITKENDPLSPRPRYYLRFESFPKTTTDKPLRRMIKKMAAEMLGLSDST